MGLLKYICETVNYALNKGRQLRLCLPSAEYPKLAHIED